jgi:hypothetical protein
MANGPYVGLCTMDEGKRVAAAPSAPSATVEAVLVSAFMPHSPVGSAVRKQAQADTTKPCPKGTNPAASFTLGR